jgi:hypothetical protein
METLQKAGTARMQMTLESFIEELTRVSTEFGWRLEPDLGKGSERREWTRFQIRAVADEGEASEFMLDPIGAVCYATTGKVCNNSESEAAEKLGLPEELAVRITDAANDKTWHESNGRRRPNTDLQALRVEIIRAVESTADPDE